jgi:hypothetical protein
MSVDANDLRDALFVLCLQVLSLRHKRRFNRPRNPSNPDPDGFDQTQAWKSEEIQLDDGRTLVLDYT